MRWTAPTAMLVAGLAALLCVPFVPGALADTGTTTSTTTICTGGQTDPYAIPLTISGIQTYPGMSSVNLPTAQAYYLSMDDHTFWAETNGASGLERTAKVCYTDTYDATGAIVSATAQTIYPADTQIVP